MSLVSTPVVMARAAAPKKVARKIQAKASAEGASKSAGKAEPTSPRSAHIATSCYQSRADSWCRNGKRLYDG